MIKILFVIDSFSTGGKERQMTELIKHLDSKQYEISVLAKEFRGEFYEQIKDRLKFTFELGRLNYKISDVFLYKRYLKRSNADIIFSFFHRMTHFVALANILNFKRAKLINASIRDAIIKPDRRLKIERFLYRFYHTVVANSEAGLKAYHQFGKKNRYILYNGFDFNRIPKDSKEEIRSNLSLNKDRFIISMAGSFSPNKDQKSLIKAFLKLEQHDNIQVLFLGDGPNLQTLKSEYKDITEDKIRFLGNRDDVEAILKASDLSVLMTAAHWGEGIPNVVLESFAVGTPAIASDNGGTSEILNDGENGFLIEPGNVEELTQKIDQLYKNNELRLEFSKNAKKTVENKFNLTKMTNTFEKIVKARLKK